MKEIKAFIHRSRIGAALEAVKLCGGTHNINVASVQSLLPPVDASEQRYSMDLAEPVIHEYKLELLCEDAQAARLARVIADAARTGQAEAGWVTVAAVESATRVGNP